jgi:hypothetical protein
MNLEKIWEEQVYQYRNAIPDPQELLDAIEETEFLEGIEPVVPKWNDWPSSSGDHVIFGKRKDLRLENVDELPDHLKSKALYIIHSIQKAIRRVGEAYVKDRNLNIEPNLSPFVGVSKYLPGCEMGPHFDAQAGDEKLFYSMIFYLNDDYEGGEISFVIRDQDLRLEEFSHLLPVSDINDPINEKLIDFALKPKAGDAMIFPSTAPYRHRVHLMKSGSKYIIPGFILQPGASVQNY